VHNVFGYSFLHFGVASWDCSIDMLRCHHAVFMDSSDVLRSVLALHARNIRSSLARIHVRVIAFAGLGHERSGSLIAQKSSVSWLTQLLIQLWLLAHHIWLLVPHWLLAHHIRLLVHHGLLVHHLGFCSCYGHSCCYVITGPVFILVMMWAFMVFMLSVVFSLFTSEACVTDNRNYACGGLGLSLLRDSWHI